MTGAKWDAFWSALCRIHDPTRGPCTQRHVRRAMIEVGMIDPPAPMPEHVKAELRERAALRKRLRPVKA